MKRLATVGLVAGVLTGALYLGRSLWLPLPAALLVAEDPADRADVIFILSGQDRWRVPTAARLYRKGHATRILLTGTAGDEFLSLATGQHLSHAEMSARVLERLGVPREALVLMDDDATSTYEEAVALNEYVRASKVESVILVTSHLHSRRARWIFRKVLSNPSGHAVKLSVVEAEHSAFTVEDWWQSEDGLLTVFNEYLKLAYYVVHY